MFDLSLPDLTNSPTNMSVAPSRLELSPASFNDGDIFVDTASGTTTSGWSQNNDDTCVYFFTP
jgi:hypothetical protein